MLPQALALFIFEKNEGEEDDGDDELVALQTDVVVLTRPWREYLRLFLIAAYRRTSSLAESDCTIKRHILHAIERACPPLTINTSSKTAETSIVDQSILVNDPLTRALLYAAGCEVFGDLLLAYHTGLDLTGPLIGRVVGAVDSLYGWLPLNADQLAETPFANEPLYESDAMSFAEVCCLFDEASNRSLSFISLQTATE